jgi:agmatinase
MSSRIILDSLAVLVREGHLGGKAAVQERHAWGPQA